MVTTQKRHDFASLAWQMRIITQTKHSLQGSKFAPWTSDLEPVEPDFGVPYSRPWRRDGLRSSSEKPRFPLDLNGTDFYKLGTGARKCPSIFESLPNEIHTGIGPPGSTAGRSGRTAVMKLQPPFRGSPTAGKSIQGRSRPTTTRARMATWSSHLRESLCPDCGGTGKYVGFSVVENCQRCGGGGCI